MLNVINPASGKKIQSLKTDSSDDIQKKYQNARNALLKWRAVPSSEKKRMVLRFGELVDKNSERLAQLLTDEMGKPIEQSRQHRRPGIGAGDDVIGTDGDIA